VALKTKTEITLTAIDFSILSTDEIFFLRTQLEKELKKRKIKFNVGEIGETIAISHFNNTAGLDNLLRAPTGTKNVDALSRRGERYSIKTLKDGTKTGTVYPDSEDDTKQLFEYLLLVQLNEDFELNSLHRFSWKQFVETRKWDITMNAWYIAKTKSALGKAEALYERK
jgi:hypothetical protein